MTDTQDLLTRITALEEWKKQRERQQITFPLDQQSIDILSKYLMRITGTIITTGGASGNVFTTYVGNQNNLNFQVSENTFVLYTVNTTSNIFTVNSDSKYRFFDDTQVFFVTEDTLPAPLTETNYYVVSADAEGLSFNES